MCLQLFTKPACSPPGALMELQAGGKQQAVLSALCSRGFFLVPCGGNFPVAYCLKPLAQGYSNFYSSHKVKRSQSSLLSGDFLSKL